MFCFDKENDMGKFVPFIVRSEDAQRIDVKIRRMNRSDAKQTEKELLKQGKLFFIKRGKTIIQTTYPEKYETRSEDSNWM